MASQKSTSLQAIHRQRRHEEFVGRDDQIAIFDRNLTLPLEHRRFIFNLSGQAGIGKTSLLHRFRQLAESAKAIVARTDNAEIDVTTVLGRVAEQLESQGYSLKAFSERYKVYRQRRQELETDPDAPQGLPSLVGRTLAKTSIHLARRAPAVGIAFDYVDEDAFAAQAGEWMAYIARKITNKDEVRLVQEPIPVLTSLFLARLYPFSEHQNRGGVSLLFSVADFLNICKKWDIQKVSLMFMALSLLFTSPVHKMDKVELRGS